MARWVFHVDLDQFIAAVEVLRRPELVGKPVVVGGDGDPTKRGVVSTASYEARRFGVRSGMALRLAYRRCPEATFLPVDADVYLAASKDVMDTLRSFPTIVEEGGWDEAFLDAEAADPEAFAKEVQAAVLERTRLWCSIGVGDSKLRAKLASGLAKPRGVFRLTRENWGDVMDPQPTEALWGIGSKTARKLAELGIRTVEQLRTADEGGLAAAFGPNIGPWLRLLATGEDGSKVSPEPHVPRGRGRERTFQKDLTDEDDVRRAVTELARAVAEDVESWDRPVTRVIVKIRFAPFFTASHRANLEQQTLDPDEIERAALQALAGFDLDRPVRLVGVRAELATPP